MLLWLSENTAIDTDEIIGIEPDQKRGLSNVTMKNRVQFLISKDELTTLRAAYELNVIE